MTALDNFKVTALDGCEVTALDGFFYRREYGDFATRKERVFDSSREVGGSWNYIPPP